MNSKRYKVLIVFIYNSLSLHRWYFYIPPKFWLNRHHLCFRFTKGIFLALSNDIEAEFNPSPYICIKLYISCTALNCVWDISALYWWSFADNEKITENLPSEIQGPVYNEGSIPLLTLTWFLANTDIGQPCSRPWYIGYTPCFHAISNLSAEWRKLRLTC